MDMAAREDRFHSDSVEYNEELSFHVWDREKDMFISGGENVYPAEVENLLYRHPAVHMCAMIGMPDEKWIEIVKAGIVLKPEATVRKHDRIAHMPDHLARPMVPKSVEILDALPLSSIGKILKCELRDQCASYGSSLTLWHWSAT